MQWELIKSMDNYLIRYISYAIYLSYHQNSLANPKQKFHHQMHEKFVCEKQCRAEIHYKYTHNVKVQLYCKTYRISFC